MKPLLATVLAACCLTPTLVGEESDPKSTTQAVIEALRNNDITTVVQTVSPDIEELQAEWDANRSESDPDADAMLNMQLGMIMNPEMNETTIANARMEAEQLPPPNELAQQINQVGMLLPMLAAQNPELAEAPELKLIQNIIPDLSAWIATGVYNDPDKAEASTRALLEGLQALGITSVDDIRSLEFSEFTDKMGGALAAVKQFSAVYDADIDAFLDSFTFGEISGSDDEREMNVTFTLLGKERSLTTTLKQIDGVWMPKIVETVQQSGMIPGMGPGPGGPGMGGPGMGGPPPGDFDEGFEDFEDAPPAQDESGDE